MDITEPLRDFLIVSMEDALEDNPHERTFRMELTITRFHASPSMPNTTPSYRREYFSREALSSTLQNLRASSAGISSSTQE